MFPFADLMKGKGGPLGLALGPQIRPHPVDHLIRQFRRFLFGEALGGPRPTAQPDGKTLQPPRRTCWRPGSSLRRGLIRPPLTSYSGASLYFRTSGFVKGRRQEAAQPTHSSPINGSSFDNSLRAPFVEKHGYVPQNMAGASSVGDATPASFTPGPPAATILGRAERIFGSSIRCQIRHSRRGTLPRATLDG